MTRSYSVAKQDYEISHDRKAISDLNFPNFKLYLRRALCGNPNPNSGEFLFFRILKNPHLGETCIQFLLFYNFQKFPPHKHDYHAFFVFLDEKDHVKYLIYDKGHHWSQVFEPRSKRDEIILAVVAWDHHYMRLPVKKKYFWLTRPLKFQLKELTAKQIFRFWTIDSMAQLKIRSKLFDPWDLDMKMTFRDVFICPSCQKRYLMDYMNLNGRKLEKKLHCCGRSYMAMLDLETHSQDMVLLKE
ncbi:MAG: hypothetical protein ACTSRW_01330 [Candidatus Helarchaeota archaeon]